jgi:hypothetical protein
LEQAMSSPQDDNDEHDEAAHEFDRHGLALHQLVQDYMDEHELSDAMTSVLLLDMSIKMRMIGYAMETEKPSTSGMKLELDRFRREAEDCIRTAKKSAEEFLAEAKALRVAAEAELDDEWDDEKGRSS